MVGEDPSSVSTGLRPDPRFDIAVRIAARLWRAGCWIRASLLAGCWLTLLWVPPGEAARAAVQLAIASLAVGLAFAHTDPDVLDRLGALPGLGRLADHLMSTDGRATVDASGLAEGLGVFLVTWVYVGPFAVGGLPVAVRITGLSLAIAYVWDAVLQAVIDPSWYNDRRPPPIGMRRFRRTFPLVLTALNLAALGSYSDAAREVPAAVRGVLAATPLLYYPVWVVVDLMLDAAAQQLRVAERHWRADIASDLHSAVKNPLTLLQTQLAAADPPLEETRSLVREARIAVEDLRRQLETPDAELTSRATRPLGELWETVHRTLPTAARDRCHLARGTADLPLYDADRLLVHRVLADLLTNAVTHGGQDVQVRLELAQAVNGGTQLLLHVDDDGPGVPELVLADPRSSLRLLRDRLQRLGGTLTLRPPPGGRVTASWPVHPGGAITWAAGPATPRS